MKDHQKTSINVAALVCGIIAVLSVVFYYLVIPTGVLAIVFGAQGAKTGSKLGKTGLILGIIGLSLFVLFYGIAITMIFVI